MIDLAAIAAAYAARTLFDGPQGRVSYADFMEAVEAAERSAESARPFTGGGCHELHLEWSAASFARLLGILRRGQSACLGSMPDIPLAPAFTEHAPLLILPTGGTTGRSRHVVHSAARLLGRYALQERPAVRQLVLYAPGHIAGLDAFFQALHRGATLIIPADRSAASVAAAISTYAVEVLPATPTYLQFLLLSGALDEIGDEIVTGTFGSGGGKGGGKGTGTVRFIPHGAEPMAASLRARLQSAFPAAQLLQRFGMTELGALPVRPDPEDPAALFLDAPGYAWKMVQGELWIQSPTRMLGTLEDGPVSEGDWHATGDLAELTPRGSLRILGRREALINVGGEKIVPERVEALLLEQPAVCEARVFARPNPLTGQAVVAEVVYADAPDPMALLTALRQSARAKGLSLAHVPTRLLAVDSLPITSSGKRPRHA